MKDHTMQFAFLESILENGMQRISRDSCAKPIGHDSKATVGGSEGFIDIQQPNCTNIFRRGSRSDCVYAEVDDCFIGFTSKPSLPGLVGSGVGGSEGNETSGFWMAAECGKGSVISVGWRDE
jgi:hypothetical protein